MQLNIPYPGKLIGEMLPNGTRSAPLFIYTRCSSRTFLNLAPAIWDGYKAHGDNGTKAAIQARWWVYETLHINELSLRWLCRKTLQISLSFSTLICSIYLICVLAEDREYPTSWIPWPFMSSLHIPDKFRYGVILHIARIFQPKHQRVYCREAMIPLRNGD